MGIITFIALALALIGVYGLVMSVTHILPWSSTSLLWGILALLSVVPIVFFVKFYLETFVPGSMSRMSSRTKIEAVTINPDVNASLEQIPSLPEAGTSNSIKLTLHCQKIQNADGASSVWYTGFVIQGMPDKTPIFLLNEMQNRDIEKWTVDSDVDFKSEPGGVITIADLTPVNKQKLTGLDPKEADWKEYNVVDAAAVTNSKIIIAAQIWNPRSSYRLYLYDLTTSTITPIPVTDVAASTSNLGSFFEIDHLTTDTSLVLTYSKNVREAAEIYHNYYNHVFLVSPSYPNGVEVLRLGIDVGNIKQWQVRDKTLYMQTEDTRNPKQHKVGYWSLDLSKVL